MNCHVHVDSPAIGACKLCDTPICSECLTVVKGSVVCPDCIAQLHNRTDGHAFSADQPESSPHEAGVNSGRETLSHARNGFLTFILSCCAPGVGHLYLGLTKMGIELMALLFGCIFLIVELNTPFPFAFIIPILYCYGIFDALQKRDQMLKGIAVDAQSTLFKGVQWEWVNKNWLGWAVLIVGALILLNKLDLFGFVRRSINGSGDMIVALLLVAAGIFIIYRQRLAVQSGKQEQTHE